MRARQPAVDDLRDALAQIADITRQLNARVTELLTCARGDDEASTVHMAACDLRDVVRSAVDSFRARAELQQLALDPSLPAAPCSVNVDAARLQQQLQILLDNAVRYTPEGGQIRV